MKVFVVGGTGEVGHQMVVQLLAAGYQVTALARSAQRSEMLQAAGARVPFTFGWFTITPYLADHSAYDAFLPAEPGRRVARCRWGRDGELPKDLRKGGARRGGLV